MINRILIRIKVVQILYSYLLSRSEFQIDSAPEAPSRDRRFAYAVYLDMLLLIQELSGIRVNCPDRPALALDLVPRLKTNRVGRELADNPALKAITFKDSADIAAIAPCLQMLADKICATEAFRDYNKKRNRTLDDDVRFWTTQLQTTILKDQDLVKALRSNPDFSLTGFNHGIMQAVDTLNAYNDTRRTLSKARTDLDASLHAAYDLYLDMFALIVELTQEERDRIDSAKTKYLATADDLNPDTRFVDNRFAAFLAESPMMAEFIKNRQAAWIESPGLLKGLLDSIMDSELYADYMAAPSTDWQADCEFWRSVIKNIVIPSDSLAEALESKSIFWNDDLPTIGTFVVKSIRHFATSDEPSDQLFLPPFKDDEDEQFGIKLFDAAVENRESYRALIDRFISTDWDPERLAFMDIVIMTVALAEITNFPAIPIPVSLNEYIEIANAYSTRRSGPFINGILYSVVKTLIDEGTLRKPFGQQPLKS